MIVSFPLRPPIFSSPRRDSILSDRERSNGTLSIRCNSAGNSSDLKNFIAANRIPCTIDRVNGVIETNRPDDKNKQYQGVVKQGDALITKLQKYGQAVRLRGSERV